MTNNPVVMMNYQERIHKVIDFIGQHLDEKLDIETLCQVACFSKYHFHRLFSAYSGVSLMSYIKWLRLKRAAHQLIMQKEDTMIHIALNAGFESHEAFSRAFKQTCGQSPTQFRRTANWEAWEKPMHAAFIKGTRTMKIIVKTLPARKLAVMEHRGDPMKLSVTIDKLITWAKARRLT